MCSTGWFGLSSLFICSSTTFQVQSSFAKTFIQPPAEEAKEAGRLRKTKTKPEIENKIHHLRQPVLLHVTLILVNGIFIQMWGNSYLMLDKIKGKLTKRKMSTLFFFNLNSGLQEVAQEDKSPRNIIFLLCWLQDQICLMTDETAAMCSHLIIWKTPPLIATPSSW